MSRKPSASLEKSPSDDICPVCKSNRYLNPSLQFLINPECYHKMCSTCVDRIFTSGPASCPVPYCGRTLRKKGFHKAFFGDLSIEREVDIRRRVANVFNKREEEFETLLDWNNYLQDVEDLTFDIVNGSKEERARAEEKLEAYKRSNEADIEDNRRFGMEEAERIRKREIADKEAARRRRIEELQEDRESKLDVVRGKQAIIDRLATSNEPAAKITAQASKVILKKSSARRAINPTNASTNPLDASNTTQQDTGLTLRGLRKKLSPTIEKPYDPFGGLSLSPARYVLQPSYESEWLVGAKTDPRHTAGGYSLQEYYARTMFEAFSGLGVFIEDEVGHRVTAQPVVGSGNGAGRVKEESEMDVDDVF